jgi:tape measure domain-containing protein
MDLKLSIQADYQQASKAFQELANSSEATREKIEKFSASFKTEHLNKFIDKQKLLEASLTGTRGEVSAMTAVQKNYEKEIEKLIRSGLDPESDAIKKLRDEHDKLTTKIEVSTKAHQMQEKAVKGAQMALAAIGAAIVAAGGFALKAAANVEDMTAAFTPLMGSADKAAKLVSQISMEAAQTPFEIDRIGDSVKRLLPAFSGSSQAAMEAFRMIGDTAQGNAEKLDTITAAYSKAMLKGKVSMMELNQIANTGVPIYDELAKSMGVSVAEMMKLSSAGGITSADLTNAFQKMTSEGGIFFKGMEVSSTTFSSTLLGIKENIGIVAGEIGMNLLPAAKEMAGKIYDATRNLIEWINTGDNFKRTVDIMIYALSGVTAGLVAFLAVTKGAAVIHGLATAFKALTSAIAANPIGAIAVVITAVLIPALIYLYKNWDTVQTYLQQGLARLQFAFKWLGSVIEEGLVVAFNTVKAAGASLLDFIIGNLLSGIANMLEVMGKLPFVGDLFQAASQKVDSLSNAIGNMAEETKRASAEAIQAAHDKQDATQAELENTLAAIDAKAQARRAAIEEQKKQNEENNEAIIESEIVKQEQLNELREGEAATLAERLNAILLTEQQIQNQQIQQLQRTLQQRMALELAQQLESENSEITAGEKKIAWLEEQKTKVLKALKVEGGDKVALEKAFNNMILEEDTKLKNAQEKLMKEKLSASTTFFKGISDLAGLASGKSIGLLIVEKAAASAQAAINSYLAFTNALASVPFPFNAAAAAGVLASGLAQQAKILSTSIPSAETGGRFIVPNSAGSDSALMKVNQGEEVNITPRGMAGFTGTQNITVQIEKQTIFDVVNNGIRSGDILIMATNY